MSNENETSRQSSPPPAYNFDKFNFLPHVLNLLNLIHSDADTVAVSTEAAQLRSAFNEARSEAVKIPGSNLGIKEQKLVIAKLTERVNATKAFLEELRRTQPTTLRNGHTEGEPMDLEPKTDES